MKHLVDEVIRLIENKLVGNAVNLVRLEDFDSPIIYMHVCDHFRKRFDGNFEGILETKKFKKFLEAKNSNWNYALDYLESNGFIKENEPLTKYRNASIDKRDTSLTLLMGDEESSDKGSLSDFFRVSLGDIVAIVSNNYSKWFDEIFTLIDDHSDNIKIAINNIYKAIFTNINIDVVKFSEFIDDLSNQEITSADDLLECIFNSLNKCWKFPSIRSNFPKLHYIDKENKTVKIINSSYKFYNNCLNLPHSVLNQLNDKFKKYAEDNDIDEETPFECFTSYNQYTKTIIEHINNHNIDENRKKIIECDFGIINKILGLNTVSSKNEKVKTKNTVIKLKGKPLDVYIEMILKSFKKFSEQFIGETPTELKLQLCKVKLSNCTLDNDEQSNNTLESNYMDICSFMGGIVNFINKKALNYIGVSLKYINDIDPFNLEYLGDMRGRLDCVNKWGADSEITFTMFAIGNSEEKNVKLEFKWSFSPYSDWKNAFLPLKNFSKDYYNPKLLCCENMYELLVCESEEEFYIKLEKAKYIDLTAKYNEMVKIYRSTTTWTKYGYLCAEFCKWVEILLENGFYNAIEQMQNTINAYTSMLENATEEYDDFSSAQKENIPLLMNCFTIISDSNYLQNLCSSEIIIPAYNPAMLEKIDAQNNYNIYSFRELLNFFTDNVNNEKSIDETVLKNKISEIKTLSKITQTVDLIPDGKREYLLCKNVWGYYALYYRNSANQPYISNIEFASDEVTVGDEDADISSQAKVIEKNIHDYIKTFPTRIDGLNICFIAPQNIQYIVEGVGKYAEFADKNSINGIINLRIVCFEGSKNVSGYLRFWLNNFMSKDRNIKINASIKYIKRDTIDTELPRLLECQDICFIYDIMRTDNVKFEKYEASNEDIVQQMSNCQFPMTFIPDTITSTHSSKRNINISQTQFLVSSAYTQLVYKIDTPYSVSGKFKVMQQLSLEQDNKSILNFAHEKCKWVVCEDKVIDRSILKDDKKKIIGFSTGEGCFGEYNVTVSANETTLNDIKNKLTIRLIDTFDSWSNKKAKLVADNCLKMTESFDGSRILKALNPLNYEIHNFLAYALMVKELNLQENIEGKYISKNLLNLDSYQHWLDTKDKRPDFMLIEIPLDENLIDKKAPLKINLKIIECKMSYYVDRFLDKACQQIQKGISILKEHWNPNNQSVNRRYWFTQLYRAIAFATLGVNDNSPYYETVNSKIYGILNGHFEIEWSADVFSYDLVSDSSISEVSEYKIDNCDSISDIVLHKAGQIYIQKMLLPENMQNDEIKYSNIKSKIQENSKDDMDDDSNLSIEDMNISEKNQKTIDNQSEKYPIESKIVETNHNKEPELQGEKNDLIRNISDVRILLGEDQRTKEKYYWEFGNKELNNRHLLINGNSGCGKTYCIQGLLMEAALQGVSSVVFDYTGGFTNSKLDDEFKKRLGDRIHQRIVRVSKIPTNPFKKNEIQIDDDILVPETDVDVASKIAEIFKTVYNLGDQQKSLVYSAVINGLRVHGDNMTFKIMAEELKNLSANTVLSKIQTFIDIDPFTTNEKFDWSDIRDSDGMVYVIQLAGFERETQVLLTEILLWDIWNFSVKSGNENTPFILVLDEAQNLSHGEKSPSAKILTEGRKFGLSGWYATQFMKPQLTNDEIQRLQQAGQKLYFCPPDDGVMDVAKNIDINLQVAKTWSEKLKRLKKGECVTCGSMVKNGRWNKYEPRIIKVTSLQERMKDER